ncbi:response regulator transcription factor [bacterium]|nr:response regulator transcription factor [bacterium]
MVTVSVVDDDVIVRDGLTALINGIPGFKCIQTYSSCEAMLNNIQKCVPDVLLMDIIFRGISGIEGVRRVKELLPNLPVLMLTVHMENDMIMDALQVGADGYIVKGTSPIRLVDSIKEAYDGGSPMSSQIARKVLTLLKQKNIFKKHNENYHLNELEENILYQLAAGDTYEHIGTSLNKSPNTVKYHVRKIYKKLQSETKSEAVAKAIRLGII